MDKNTKSLIKKTILGLIGGGTLSALYAVGKNKEDEAAAKGSVKNDIVVPLSKRNFMRPLTSSEKTRSQEKDKTDMETKPIVQDIAGMSASDLASLKKALLRKRASAPERIGEKNGPVASTSGIRRSKAANYTTLRNGKGQFSTEANMAKTSGDKGGVLSDAGGVVLDAAGVTGGFLAGMTVVKALTDRVMANRKKKQLEAARREYTNMLLTEIEDEDTPYYTKRAEDRGMLGSTLGYAAVAGLGTSALTGLVIYRILENRRKLEEKLQDKDLSKYPFDKTIKFKFAESKGKNKDFFG